jgi:heterodisulfide reductase subunit A
VDTCPYNAISLESYEEDGKEKVHIVTDKALCKGCGLCMATCPKGGVDVAAFSLNQLRAQVKAALGALG